MLERIQWFLGVLADHKIELFLGAAVLFILGLIGWSAVTKEFDRVVGSEENDRNR